MNDSSDESDEKTEEQYEYEFEQIAKMFPNAKFTIAIDIEELDEVVTEQPEIIIKQEYSCYCYDDCKKNTEYIHISGAKITNKFIIDKLIEYGLVLDCNHCFVEGFNKMQNSICQFEIITGS